MHAEMMLVCKLMQTGKLPDAIEFGITPDDFTQNESKVMYERLLTVYQSPQSSGTVLGPTSAQKEFPHLPWAQVDDHVTCEYLFHEVRKGRLRAMISKALLSASEKIDADDVGACISELREIMAEVSELGESRNHDTNGAAGLQQVMKHYDRVKSGEETGVAEWAWYELGKHAGPIVEDDYIVFYGRPKNMKTWLLLYQAASCVLRQDIPTIIYTKEMTKENLYRRLASIIAEIPYQPLRLGTLAANLERRFKDALNHLIQELRNREKENLLWVLSGKDMAGKDTISWFRSKVGRYKPKIAFIDGMYLMSPENAKLVSTTDRLMSVSRAARNMILETGVPLICTLQANRQAAKHEKGALDEIAMSDAFSQDCTAALRTIKDTKKHAETGKQTVSVVVAGSREWNVEGVRIFGEPSTDFSFCEYMDEAAIQKAKEADAPVEGQADKKKKTGKSDANRIQKLVDSLTPK